MYISDDTRLFIRQHRNDDVRRLALQGSKSPGVDMPVALQQIRGWQIACSKIPSWAALDDLVYPPHLNMEQCSSEPAARYKAEVIARLMRGMEASRGMSFVDLTGGLGVDFAFICQGLRHETNETCETKETYVEQDPQLCAISSHNFPLLGLSPQVVCGDAATYLRQLAAADVIYLDPARRDAYGAKTFAMADCTPDVCQLRDELLAKSRFTVVKLSPMLDWHEAVRALREVSEVHIVAIGGECKELLLVLHRHSMNPMVTCVNDGESFSFKSDETVDFETFASEIDLLNKSKQYLYEPNAAIMKAGCFGVLASRLGVQALSRNSHLFVASHFIERFPGRKFLISSVSSMNKQELRRSLGGIDCGNVAVRNFPLKAEELRRRLKLKDGGNVYIFGTTLSEGQHRLLLCRQIHG